VTTAGPAASTYADLKLQAQNDIAEVRLRQEWAIGQWLAAMEKHAGGRPAENRSHDDTSFLRYHDLGLAKMQAHRPYRQ